MIVPRFRIEIKLLSFVRILAGLKKFRSIEDKKLLFFNSGTEAITFFLKSISKARKLKVGVPLYCCRQVYQSVISSGNLLQFVDIGISANGYKIHHADLENLDVLIFVHYFGFQYDKLEEIKSKFANLILIEDCSHLSFKKFKKSGISNAAVFSFNFHKPIPAGVGGCLLLDNEQDSKGIYENYNSLPRASFVQGLKTLCRVFLKNFAFSPMIYFFLEKYITARRRRPLINIRSIVRPQKVGLVGKVLIGNQLTNNHDFLSRYRRLPDKMILKDNDDSLSYFPIFCRSEHKRDSLLEKFKQKQIDVFILWENTFYNAFFYGLRNADRYQNTKDTLAHVLFIPEFMLISDKRFHELLQILGDDLT